MIPCAICGAVVADGSQHLSWHRDHGDLEGVDLFICPLDGSDVAMMSSSDGTRYSCGHWLRPAPSSGVGAEEASR